MSDPDKPRFPLSVAKTVAREIVLAIQPSCHRLLIAGSFRRRKPTVGDLEILYIPFLERRWTDFFDPAFVDTVADKLEALCDSEVIYKRPNAKGQSSWGEQNKLAVHTKTGMPIDFFRASVSNWFNYLVCRTGPAEINMRIAATAKAKGWKWNPYGSGFTRGGPLSGTPEVHHCHSEKEVFNFVGLPYCQPCDRR